SLTFFPILIYDKLSHPSKKLIPYFGDGKFVSTYISCKLLQFVIILVSSASISPLKVIFSNADKLHIASFSIVSFSPLMTICFKYGFPHKAPPDIPDTVLETAKRSCFLATGYKANE